VENAKKAAKCIEDNIAFTKFGDKSRLIVQDVRSAIAMMEGKYRFDLIFMDPPYDKGLEKEVLRQLTTSSLLKENTILIVEASLHTSFDDVEEMGYEVTKYKKYKTNAHIFLRKK
jgi:16S rRNA (guanine966-N2)-methyltransferase